VDTVRFGRSVRALRRHKHLRQLDVAARAGCSQALIARVEGGRAGVVTPAALERIAGALGARVVLRLDWNGEALDRLLDEAHASIVESVVRSLQSAGWEIIAEATFAIDGERGSVDVLAWHAASRSLLVVEVKWVVADSQDTLAKLAREVRLSQRIAPPTWRAEGVSCLLVIGHTRTNRRRVASLEATFAAAFPDRAPRVRQFLRAPAGPPIRGLWFLAPSTQANARHRVRRV
jgi:transcriptional regulator with XRE-family HTH domain